MFSLQERFCPQVREAIMREKGEMPAARLVWSQETGRGDPSRPQGPKAGLIPPPQLPSTTVLRDPSSSGN